MAKKRVSLKSKVDLKKAKREVAKYQKQLDVNLKKAEEKLLEHYRGVVKASGKQWGREGKKYQKKVKTQLKKAGKTINAQMRRKPAASAALVAAAGVAIGAIAASLLVKRKK
jgi:hypothetical protein